MKRLPSWLRLSPPLLCAVIACRKPAPDSSQASVSAASPSPGAPSRGSPSLIAITADSVGPIALWSPLRLLRALHFGSRDTVTYGQESAYPAVSFPLGPITAVASEDRDSLELDAIPDAWAVVGQGGILPGGVPLSAPWSQLYEHYGRATGIVGNNAVMFCRMPGIFLEFPEPIAESETADSLSPAALPPESRVTQLLIRRVLPAGWACNPP